MDNQINITHILYSGLGGTTDYVFNLIKGDISKQFKHSLIFYGVEAINTDTLKAANELSKYVTVIQKKRGLDRGAIRQLKQAVLTTSSSTVTCHINSLILPLSSFSKGKFKLLFVEHQANHLKTKREKYWSLFAQRKAEVVISLTESYQENLKELVGRYYRPDKNKVIQSGIVLSDYFSSINKGLSLRIGMVSRINGFRDHETLIKAFLKLKNPNISLHIAGDGPLKEELSSRYKSEHIHWHGLLNQQAIITFLAGLDIYVHASKGETSSMAIMQAMASELPIIASDVIGIKIVVENSQGVLVEVKNSSALSIALTEFIESSEKRLAHSVSSGQYAKEHFDHIKMFQQYAELL